MNDTSGPFEFADPVEPLMLRGSSVRHYVGREVNPEWRGGGSHHSLCGLVSGFPEVTSEALAQCARCGRLRRFERERAERPAPKRHPESFTLAAWLIENEMSPPGWAEAFCQVKFDTADNPEWEGERYIVVVAKGEHADRIAEAYDRG